MHRSALDAVELECPPQGRRNRVSSWSKALAWVLYHLWTLKRIQDKPTFREKALKSCDQNIQRTILLTQEMIRLADQGDAEREDVGCGILYGILRDSAYKLWRMAEEEKKRHQAKGWWQVPCVLNEIAPDKTNDLTPIFDKPEKED